MTERPDRQHWLMLAGEMMGARCTITITEQETVRLKYLFYVKQNDASRMREAGVSRTWGREISRRRRWKGEERE